LYYSSTVLCWASLFPCRDAPDTGTDLSGYPADGIFGKTWKPDTGRPVQVGYRISGLIFNSVYKCRIKYERKKEIIFNESSFSKL
jgi:hypothetical protein